MMLRGQTVTVHTPKTYGVDRFNNTVVTAYADSTVNNVLIAPGASSDLEASRPEGVKVAFTLHFPKTFTDSLRDCLVELPAPYSGTYRVIGDPQPYQPGNTPTKWHLACEVVEVSG